MQDYRTLAGKSEARIVEKKSEFIATAAPVSAEAEALAVLEAVRAAHRTASHNVYAYVLRENARQRYSDDGEPQKTAGLPVLSVITHAGLTDCIVVVTRYFGGTLLGTGGLVRAYTRAAQGAIAAAGVQCVQSLVTLRFSVEYALFEQAKRLLEAAGAKVEEPVFGQQVELSAHMPAGTEGPLLEQLSELGRGSLHVQVGEPFYGVASPPSAGT